MNTDPRPAPADLEEYALYKKNDTPGGDNAVDNLARTMQQYTEALEETPIDDLKKSHQHMRIMVSTNKALTKNAVGVHAIDLDKGEKCEEINMTQLLSKKEKERKGYDSHCTICYEVWEDFPSPTALKCGQCGHITCTRCVMNMRQKSYHKECPLCRTKILMPAYLEQLLTGNTYAEAFQNSLKSSDYAQLYDQKCQLGQVERALNEFIIAQGMDYQSQRKVTLGQTLRKIKIVSIDKEIEIGIDLSKHIDGWHSILNMSKGDIISLIKGIIESIVFFVVIERHYETLLEHIFTQKHANTTHMIRVSSKYIKIRNITNAAKLSKEIKKRQYPSLQVYMAKDYFTAKDEIIYGIEVKTFGKVTMTIHFQKLENSLNSNMKKNEVIIVERNKEKQLTNNILRKTQKQRHLNNDKEKTLRKQEKDLQNETREKEEELRIREERIEQERTKMEQEFQTREKLLHTNLEKKFEEFEEKMAEWRREKGSERHEAQKEVQATLEALQKQTRTLSPENFRKTNSAIKQHKALWLPPESLKGKISLTEELKKLATKRRDKDEKKEVEEEIEPIRSLQEEIQENLDRAVEKENESRKETEEKGQKSRTSEEEDDSAIKLQTIIDEYTQMNTAYGKNGRTETGKVQTDIWQTKRRPKGSKPLTKVVCREIESGKYDTDPSQMINGKPTYLEYFHRITHTQEVIDRVRRNN